MIIVLLPAYNEENNIGTLLQDIENVLGGLEMDHRIVVVDDGSTDRTGEILDDLSKELPLEVVHHPENRNLGGAMRTGLKTVLDMSQNGDFIITLDADNSHPPKEIINLYDRLLDGPDVVVASRYHKGGEEIGVPRIRVFLSRGANWLFKFLFPIEGVSDYTGSFRGFRVERLLQAWDPDGPDVLRETGFTVMPEILLRLRGKGCRFAEIPLVLRYDLKGDPSKMKIFENILGTISLMVRMFVGGLFGRKR